MSIQRMRRNYIRGGLDESDVDADPMVQFQLWFGQAQQEDLPDWFEPNAMTLSTCDRSGNVSSRTVLLKAADKGRFVFFTNYQSEKGRQLAENPRASLCFFWPHLERQVRIAGFVQPTDREESIKYFGSRPRDSQLGAHVSEQSSTIKSREWLETRMQELQTRYADNAIPCPENWGGYALIPESIEFWQGRPSRLHDRICYRRANANAAWQIVRLSP